MTKQNLPGDPTKHEVIDEILRVDHAGERGAINIYKGQLEVLGNHPVIGPKLREMLENEQYHYDTFTDLINKHQTRPTALMPLWDKLAYYVLGKGTALLGVEAAMACTDAVEDVIGKHYHSQLDQLNDKDDKPLKKIIKEFRDDELAHQDTAIEFGAKQAPAYGLLSTLIKGCCHIAIKASKKI